MQDMQVVVQMRFTITVSANSLLFKMIIRKKKKKELERKRKGERERTKDRPGHRGIGREDRKKVGYWKERKITHFMWPSPVCVVCVVCGCAQNWKSAPPAFLPPTYWVGPHLGIWKKKNKGTRLSSGT